MDAPSSPLRRRSILLTVCCAVAFAGALQALAFSFSPVYRELAAATGARWLPAFVFASSLLGIVCLVALWWRMRRWAVWGYLGVAAAQNVAWAALGRWAPVMLVYPALVGVAAAWIWPRLR